ncbi:LytR/AlgR family response regulator transcription factor [Geomesophilobacter sediminis]|uniref:Response regulator transcription factor n=1 Tax=Geomesophilobacter sediminis TaxID=2798584 RepID=A0A8J7IP13_9BACT|nr:LytTR family DNA-binding domain-containing protein [Geomesophilobacter sediminis]MBJ6725163.1 response regulator transcription factor [Geomesophilobacter sediminis]
MTITAFIIDDEAPARRELRYLLERIEGVTVVGEAANGTAGLKGIRETRPQLVFLDIQMPGIGGLEMAQFLAELPEVPLLVFATAFDQYAVQAFEVEAIDYLCKPFAAERVAKAVAKAQKALLRRAVPEPERGEPCRRIPLSRGDAIVPTPPERIIFACCEEGEVVVHATDGRFKTRFTLNELEEKLAPAGFVRAHRSFLVNLDHVLEVIPWFNGSYKLVLDDRARSEVPVSRYNAKQLKSRLDF